MSISIDYSSYRASSPPFRRKGSHCNMGKMLKAALWGLLIAPTGVFAKDLCQKPNTAYLCKGNWGIPRSEMPQVTGAVRERFLESVSSELSVTLEQIPAHRLTPIQSQLNQRSIIGMIRDNLRGKFFPCDVEILVSRNETHDNIIDGHHTATACRLLGGRQLAAVVWDFANSVLGRLKNFPGVFHSNLRDAQKI